MQASSLLGFSIFFTPAIAIVISVSIAVTTQRANEDGSKEASSASVQAGKGISDARAVGHILSFHHDRTVDLAGQYGSVRYGQYRGRIQQYNVVLLG